MSKKISDEAWFSVRIILFCSLELLLISAGNATLDPEEESVLEVLRVKFNQPEWTGDPCAAGTWIKCSNGSQPSYVVTLTLPNANLNGSIPAEVAKLRNVQALHLQSNRLEGPIPDLQNMTDLGSLDLKENKLSGRILDTAGFNNITRIVLNDNNLTGGLPADLFNHSNLQLLYLGHNPLGGSLPDFSRLPNMKELSLQNIQLNGSIPESIQNMTEITHIILFQNAELGGPIPDISALVNLLHFNLNACSLNGSVPDLKSAPGVITVDLQRNDFSGSIPSDLFQHEALLWLNLNNNSRLSGEFPDTSGLSQVKTFIIHDCNMTGPVPSFKGALNVQYVALQNNHLTTCPSDFRHLENLVDFDVGNNSITGSLPEVFTSETLQNLIFRRNHFSGGIPRSWNGLTGLQQMLLEHNNLSGVIQEEIGNLTTLTVLLLGHNNFSGPIPKDLGRLEKLEILDLSNNQFSGDLPDEIASLPNLHKLLLDNNRFTGIPEALLKRTGLNLTYDADVKILGGTSASGTSAGLIAGVVIGFGALGAVIVILAILLFRHKRKRSFEDQLSKDDLPKSAKPFTLRDIKSITGNNKTLIGKGGFGPVYYGKLPDGKEVAVKIRAAESKQGASEFLNEVRLLSRLHHRNLVPLVGYCLEGHQQILVYAFMAQGTLHDHLYHADSGSGTNPSEGKPDDISTRRALSWETRLDIAVNAARGLEYLHTDCNPPVIHRDVKTSNILLTDHLQAKIADLGLSKQVPEPDAEEVYSTNGISTAVKGTFGYLDPEYFVRRKLTTKSDVFSFGMVLLEMITGKHPQCQDFPGEEETTLVEWVQAAVSKNCVEAIVDPSLGADYNEDGMLRIVKTALSCVLPDGAHRPDMGELLLSLTEVLEMENEGAATVLSGKSVPYSGQLNTITSSNFGQSSSLDNTGSQPQPR